MLGKVRRAEALPHFMEVLRTSRISPARASKGLWFEVNALSIIHMTASHAKFSKITLTQVTTLIYFDRVGRDFLRKAAKTPSFFFATWWLCVNYLF